jgi:hypothetical protein
VGTDENRPSWRPRISLLTALLLITIAGMAIVVARQWRELAPMRVELRKLRDEIGALTIEDNSRIHAIAVRTSDDLTWKWRVWVPEGMNVAVHYRFGQVPKTGVPQGQGGASLGPGEHWIELKAGRDRSWENWTASLTTSGGSVGTSIGPDDHWFDWKTWRQPATESGRQQKCWTMIKQSLF